MKLVPNAELREAFLRSGEAASSVAAFAGWVTKSGKPNTTKLFRALGIHDQMDNGRRYFNTRISEKSALELIEALNLDPVDFRDIGL